MRRHGRIYNRQIGRLFLSWERGDREVGAGRNRIAMWWVQVGPLLIAWDRS